MKKRDNSQKLILKDCRKAMWTAALGHTLCNSFSGLMAIYTAEKLGKLTDAVFNSNTSLGFKSIFDLVICIGIMVLLVPLIELTANLVMLKYALVHDRMILNHFLDKTYEDVAQIDIGEVQYRLEDDATDLRCNWVGIVENLIVTPLILIAVLFNSVKINLMFTLVVILFSIIKLVVPVAVRKIEAKYDKENRAYNTLVKEYETEFTEKPHLIQLFGLSVPWIEKIDKNYQNYFHNIFCKSIKCTAVATSISSFLDTFCILSILLIGAILVSAGYITAGAVAAMIGYFSVYNRVVQNIDYIVRKLPIINNIIDRMRIFYDNFEDLSGKEIDSVREISANSLSFSYGDTKVFQNIEFCIPYGSKTAIVGANGCGKTTLLRLMCGLIGRYTGELNLNNTEMQSVAIESWRIQFAFIEQEPYLFAGSVKENIHLGNLHASEGEVDAVLDECGIGYLAERKISMSQNDLSGGEKQKISIARALLKGVSYLIMDEPSNNLDKISIEWLCDFIQKSPKTLIYISHDEKLQKLADQTIRL